MGVPAQREKKKQKKKDDGDRKNLSAHFPPCSRTGIIVTNREIDRLRSVLSPFQVQIHQ